MNDQTRRSVATVVVTVLVLGLVGGLVAWLRATAPTGTADVEVPADLVTQDVITCESLADGLVPGSRPEGRATSSAILSCPESFDELVVEYVGEVVGDVLARDGGSWTLMNDDAYALRTGPLTIGGEPAGTNSGLTVWLPDPLDDLADQPGRADVRGDVLRVVGRVLRADPADGGGLTIRAREAEVVSEAVVVDLPVHWRQVGVALALAALAVVLLLQERGRRVT